MKKSIIAWACFTIVFFCFSMQTKAQGTKDPNRLFPIRHGSVWGYMDGTGKTMIKPQFKSAQPFFEGMAMVFKAYNPDVFIPYYIDRTGKTIWKKEHPIEPLTLAVDDRSVYFHNWTRLVCLDRQTGELRWRSEPAVPRDSMGYVYGPTLVLHDDVKGKISLSFHNVPWETVLTTVLQSSGLAAERDDKILFVKD